MEAKGLMMNSSGFNSEVKLRRVLSLGDLIIYGIILIQPVAALPLFGHANNLSHGHAVDSILIAMVAMVFTAVSYGRMAKLYPAAGSAYTYVGRSIHPYLGFISGWSMFMDYMFVPILCVIFTSITANHILPFINYYLWIVFFAGSFSLLNLKGIKMASRTNIVLIITMSVVVFYFMASVIRHILISQGYAGLFSTLPFYNPESFSLSALGSATALAALTYIGFDGITTLSEEVKNPGRNVLIATVLTCLITGIWSGAQVYLAQLVWPDWTSFANGQVIEGSNQNNLDTAIMAVAHRVGGALLDDSLSVVLLLGCVGAGITGQIGASRLLYAIGRDNFLPKKVFGQLDKKYSVPRNNVIIVGALSLIGAVLLNFEDCARLINFGAFFAFMSVNIAAMWELYFNQKDKTFKSFIFNFLPPAIGFLICLAIWLNLPPLTFLIGGIWMLAGILYLIIRTKGFRIKTDMINIFKDFDKN